MFPLTNLAKIHFKMLFGKWQPFCLGLNVLRSHWCFMGAFYGSCYWSERWSEVWKPTKSFHLRGIQQFKKIFTFLHNTLKFEYLIWPFTCRIHLRKQIYIYIFHHFLVLKHCNYWDYLKGMQKPLHFIYSIFQPQTWYIYQLSISFR